VGGGTTQQRLPSREWGTTEPAAASRSRRAAAAACAPLASLTPRQRSALRALTAGVAVAGDLPLLAASIAWVMLARDALPSGPPVEGGGGAASAASANGVTMNVLLPALSALLCLWHLTAALMAVVGPGSEASSQAASAKLFSSGASSALWVEEAEEGGGVVGMAGAELARGGFHLHEQAGHHAAQSSAAAPVAACTPRPAPMTTPPRPMAAAAASALAPPEPRSERVMKPTAPRPTPAT
jgi:hypothetical protein